MAAARYIGKKNNAYEGEHLTPSGGRSFRIYYIGCDTIYEIHRTLRECGQRVFPRGHRHRIKAGWYWISMAAVAAGKAHERVGPFTASGNAYRAAIQRLDNGKG